MNKYNSKANVCDSIIYNARAECKVLILHLTDLKIS